MSGTDKRRRYKGHVVIGVIAMLLTWDCGAVLAQELGKSSGLAVPRYVSLKSNHVNLREGPSKDHKTVWVYQQAGLPVEITAEAETWYRIRDSEGTEGWVLHSLLSGKRTVLIAPGKKTSLYNLYSDPATSSSPLAQIQTNVIAGVKYCDGEWCRVFGSGFDGYIQQNYLWGVYPSEQIE